MANLAERARRLNRGGAGGFALMTDAERLSDPLPLLPLLPKGSLVILRHYGMPGRVALARALSRECRARRLKLLVAGDLDLAIALGSGLHLPEYAARIAGARVRLWHRQSRRLLSAAAHSRTALRRAAMLGADFVLLSPLFATASHPGAVGMGLVRFRSLAAGSSLPVWALGGVTERSMGGLRGSGAAGIATVGNLARR